MRSIKNILNQFIQFSDTKTLQDLNKHHIKEWIFKGHEEKGWSPKTIRNNLQVLTSFCDWLIEDEYLSENPAKEIRRPKLKKRLPRFLNEEDAERLLNWSFHYPYQSALERARGHAIIATFLMTGLRLNELIQLKTVNLDFEQETVFVREGKGQKDRVVPLCPRLINILKVYQRKRHEAGRSCSAFFVSITQDKGIGNEVIKRLVNKLRDRSGIYFYPHMLRHTFASLLSANGCPLPELSEMMGHTSIETTSIYTHAIPRHLKQHVRKHPLSI